MSRRGSISNSNSRNPSRRGSNDLGLRDVRRGSIPQIEFLMCEKCKRLLKSEFPPPPQHTLINRFFHSCIFNSQSNQLKRVNKNRKGSQRFKY